MQDDRRNAPGSALLKDRPHQTHGVALTAISGRGVHVEHVGAHWLGVHPVRGKVGEEDAGAGDHDAVGIFKEQADVAPVLKTLADPRLEPGVGCGESGFRCEGIIRKHPVAMAGDQGGILNGRVPDGWHSSR